MKAATSILLLLLGVSLFSYVSCLKKTVVLSSLKIKNTHEIVGNDPEIAFACQYSPNGDPVPDVTNPITTTELTNVNDINYYYVVEVKLFEWDNVTSGNYIVCKTTELDDIGDSESLGVSNLIHFDLIRAEGRFFSGVNPPESDYYLRCADCQQLPNGTKTSKQIGIDSLRLSSNLEYFPIVSPDIFIQCINNGDPSVYEMNLKDVKKGDTDYTVNMRFTQWTWETDISSLQATCGIYNRGGITRQTSGIGTNIIGYTNISETGTKYYWPGDAGTWVIFKDCSDPDDCNPATLIKVSFLLVAVILALF